MDCQIPLPRLKEIIKEARLLHMRGIDVIGGEFFLYKHWKELLTYFKEYGYTPAVSTKVPISEPSIKFLADINIKAVQVSLDTLIQKNLCDLLKVKNSYISQIKETLLLFEKYDIKIFIHTVMTNINDNIDDVKLVYNFLSGLKNIVRWRLDKTSSSLYKGVDKYHLTQIPQ
jgi:pyruvate-formate lyase-activating enzyme